MKHRRKTANAGGYLTEIFGELNFEERPNSAGVEKKGIRNEGIEHRLDFSKNGFTAENLDSLQLCTEGLGSESSDDLDDLIESGGIWSCNSKENPVSYSRRPSACSNCADGKSSGRIWNFPPPISSIGKSGRPWICFRSYRHDGRFVLKEFRIPTQEYLRSSREGGRLKLHFVHPEESITEEEKDEQEKKEEEELVLKTN
ncbi:hypothetical protein KSP39_PZI014361 [Platanthera zijinensis]|uniref:FAF domain-containing protein n=1 Tax=Platanthera zijinensis TaxID=2320716 RepID=A0AAP0B9S9_9ASPA